MLTHELKRLKRRTEMKYLLLLIGLLFCGSFANGDDRVEKYPDVTVSRFQRAIDGDTFVCDIDEHSAIAGKNISIRLRGINTPELKDKDPEIRKQAYQEKDRLESLLVNAKVIQLKNLGRDKYFRIDADVYVDDKNILDRLNQKYLIQPSEDNRR